MSGKALSLIEGDFRERSSISTVAIDLLAIMICLVIGALGLGTNHAQGFASICL